MSLSRIVNHRLRATPPCRIPFDFAISKG
jgi:hypothetical protein